MQDSAQDDARTGTLLGGKYQIVRLLGRGGMGAVYEAQNSWTHRQVAIKILHSECTQRPDVVARFLQEAQTASQLQHPNIVDVLDMGQDSDGSLYIVQQFLEGADLRSVLDARGRITPAEAIDIALPLMGALAAAHRRGIVHRDIKPENVFLTRTEDGELIPKLIDFGISKIVADGSDHRNVTQAGMIVGTPNYMSPEQARGEGEIGAQSDVWSLGVVLYEMLCGRTPVDAPNQNVLMLKIIMEPAPRIETFAPDLPQELADMVHMALEQSPSHRFADMSAFIATVLQSSFGGPQVFDRHRRSIATSSDATGRLEALARSVVTSPPSFVTPMPQSGRWGNEIAARPSIPADHSASAPVISAPVTQIDTPMQWSEAPSASAAPPRPRGLPLLLVLVAGAVLATMMGLLGGSLLGTPSQPSHSRSLAASVPSVTAVSAPQPVLMPSPEPARVAVPIVTPDASAPVLIAQPAAPRRVVPVTHVIRPAAPRTPFPPRPARSPGHSSPQGPSNGAPILTM